MELSNTRIVPASPSAVWAALNDPAVLKDCLPGCETLEQTADHTWRVVMAARVGPVSARFEGQMTMSDIAPPTSYTLAFEGQGGAAGFAKGDAHVSLAPADGDATALTYTAKAQVGGKLAQIGSRLVDGAAAKMTDDFFARFVERVGAKPAAGPDEAESLAASAEREEPGVALAPAGGSPWIRYGAIVAIAVVLILLYRYGYR